MLPFFLFFCDLYSVIQEKKVSNENIQNGFPFFFSYQKIIQVLEFLFGSVFFAMSYWDVSICSAAGCIEIYNWNKHIDITEPIFDWPNDPGQKGCRLIEDLMTMLVWYQGGSLRRRHLKKSMASVLDRFRYTNDILLRTFLDLAWKFFFEAFAFL